MLKRFFIRRNRWKVIERIKQQGEEKEDPAHGIGFILGKYTYIPCCDILQYNGKEIKPPKK